MMTVENGVRLFAGCMIIASTVLVHFVSPWFLLLTLFVGLNLAQSSLTGLCPLAILLKKAGFRSSPACASCAC